MPAPPKPWEQSGAGEAGSAQVPGFGTSTDAVPTVPERPAALSAAGDTGMGMNPYRSSMGGMGNYGSGYGLGYGSGYGSGYGGYGSSYSSPYSRFGGMSGMSGMGGMGGYGGMGGMGGYGGMGGMGGYGGMGGMGGMGGFGQPGDMSLTQRMESGTQATFELISSIVSAFGGFAQMLESTFMATHSSFFAMVGVADQFAHLRNYLGQVLSIFALARYAKNLVLRLSGRTPTGIDSGEFRDFQRKGVAGRPRPNKRPLIIFFLAVIGLPYLMGKLVKMITARQEAERARLAQQAAETGTDLQQQNALGSGPIDPSKLTFVRARFPYNAADALELSLKTNEVVAVLSKTNPQTGEESQWWRGRTRDGRIGWFPSTYTETLEEARDRAAKTTHLPPSAKEAIPADKSAAKEASVSKS